MGNHHSANNFARNDAISIFVPQMNLVVKVEERKYFFPFRFLSSFSSCCLCVLVLHRVKISIAPALEKFGTGGILQ